ncbi:MAG: hypothetical protein ACHQ1D_13580, partial [Nitrososphaerales archaeon]
LDFKFQHIMVVFSPQRLLLLPRSELKVKVSISQFKDFDNTTIGNNDFKLGDLRRYLQYN